MLLATQPRPILSLIGDCYRFFWPVFKQLLPIILCFIILALAFAALSIFSVGAAQAMETSLGPVVVVISMLAFLWLFVFFYGTQLTRGYGALSADPGFLNGGSWRLAGQRTWRGIGCALVVGLILFGASMLVMLLGLALNWLLVATHVLGSDPLYSLISTILYATIAYIFILYCFLRFALTWPEIFIRGRSVVGAITESLRLTKGHCLRLFGVWLGVMLLPMIIMGLLFLFGGAYGVSEVTTQTSATEAIGAISRAGNIGELLITLILHLLVIPVLVVTASLLLLNDLELRGSSV